MEDNNVMQIVSFLFIWHPGACKNEEKEVTKKLFLLSCSLPVCLCIQKREITRVKRDPYIVQLYGYALKTELKFWKERVSSIIYMQGRFMKVFFPVALATYYNCLIKAFLLQFQERGSMHCTGKSWGKMEKRTLRWVSGWHCKKLSWFYSDNSHEDARSIGWDLFWDVTNGAGAGAGDAVPPVAAAVGVLQKKMEKVLL